MKRMSAQELIDLNSRAERDIHQERAIWEEVARYCLPNKAGVEVANKNPSSEVGTRTHKVWDSTAPEALDDLAKFLSAALTPSASEWVKLEFRDDSVREINENNEWLERCTDRMLAEINRSNFDSALGEVFQDIPAFGVGVPQVSDKRDANGNWTGLHYEAIWIGEISALADAHGEFTTTFRRYQKPAYYWLSLFGDELKGQARALAMEKPEEKVEFLHAVYPRDESDIDRAGIARGTALPNRLPYASVWVNCRDKSIVRESGYHELPRYVARWAGLSNSDWGYSPAIRALPDIRTVNEAKRLELAAWERAIDRPMKTRENNIVGDLNLGARGLTVVRDVSQLVPLFDITDFNLTAIKVDELRQSILRAFYADLIREPYHEPGERTAFEIAKRIERSQRILGEAVGHLRQMLRWLVERTFQLMYRAGQFEEPPESLMQAEGNAAIDVRYTSPLQSAQQGATLESMMIAISEVAMLAEFNPDVLDKVNFDGLVDEIFRRRNVPAFAQRDKRDVAAIREQRAEQQAQQQQAEQMQAEAETVRAVGQGAGKEAAGRMLRGV